MLADDGDGDGDGDDDDGDSGSTGASDTNDGEVVCILNTDTDGGLVD